MSFCDVVSCCEFGGFAAPRARDMRRACERAGPMRWLLLVYLVAQAIAADDSLEHSDAFAQCAADPASCTSLYVPAALHPMHATSPHDIPFLPSRIRIEPTTWATPLAHA